jgi:hypothetical protein
VLVDEQKELQVQGGRGEKHGVPLDFFGMNSRLWSGGQLRGCQTVKKVQESHSWKER